MDDATDEDIARYLIGCHHLAEPDRNNVTVVREGNDVIRICRKGDLMPMFAFVAEE